VWWDNIITKQSKNYTPPKHKKLEDKLVDIFKVEPVGENVDFSNLKAIMQL